MVIFVFYVPKPSSVMKIEEVFNVTNFNFAAPAFREEVEVVRRIEFVLE